jgi:mono/diheme cytochrome c family protein
MKNLDKEGSGPHPKSAAILLCAVIILALAVLSSGSANLAAVPPQQDSPSSPASPQRLINQYCVTCHNQRAKTAGLMFDTMDLSDVSKNADIWEKAARKLRGGMMPPPGARQPDRASVESFVSWLENSLDQAAAANPNPGRVGLHRMNRVEYANAVEDLLALRIDAAALLPKDDQANGFDNVANVLKVSPSFLDQYISAARFVANEAVGNPQPKTQSVVLRPPKGADQGAHIDGLPLGTRGGLLVEHLFPADGEYKFNINGLAGGGYVRGLEYQHRLIITIDGAKAFERVVGGEEDIKAIDQKQAPAVAAINGRFQNLPITVKAGPHKVGVTFVARTFAESDDTLFGFVPGRGEDRIARIGSVEILGPFNPAGMTATPSRQRIFVCQPASAAGEAEQLACAKQIVSTFARRAYRRPVTERDLVAPLAFYKSGKEDGGDFDSGIKSALVSILSSPKFLYRAESVPDSASLGSSYRVSDMDLASRLSFFLWSRLPDEELLNLAGQGKLKDPAVLDKQVRRMLADAKSKSLVTNFAFQWLKVRNIDEIDPDAFQFPNFDEGLRDAFKKEMELFVDSVIREDRSIVDLLTANYTFVNERLALHYGIPNVRGERFRRITLDDPNRWGLLGKGSILMVTSYPNRTAPVLRGAFILENITGTPPSPPPPDVEGFKENKDGEKAKTVREIMEKHRANPSCNACHGVMDPLGFSLENFDAIGAWRSKDVNAGTAIDASGKLVDGTPVNGPTDLRQALMRHPEQFAETVTEKLMTYALGRSVEYYDMPTIRKIVRDAGKDNYRISSIVLGIAKSTPFTHREAVQGN